MMPDKRFKSKLCFVLMFFVVLAGNGRVLGKKIIQRKMIDGLAKSFNASKIEVDTSYDPTPIPVNMSKNNIKLAIEKISNSIFFIQNTHSDSLNIEMDKFVIPNGNYSELDVEWEDIFDMSGQTVIRTATDEEKKNDKKFYRESWSRIYRSGEGKTVVATGSMQVKVPAKFLSISLTPEKKENSHEQYNLSATLEWCENDVACVSVLGDFNENKPVIVLYDKLGGRLQKREAMTSSSPTEYMLACRASGKIAKIEIFLPSEYLNETFEVKATCKPDFYGDEAWKIRAPRYVEEQRDWKFEKVDIETLKKETEVVGRRGYAAIGYNKQEICAYFPKLDNSCFANAKITELKLYDAKGRIVEHELDGGWRDNESFYQRFDIVSKDDKDKSPEEYKRSAGILKLHYPASIKIVTLTVDKPNTDGLTASFEEAKVVISRNMSSEKFYAVRAYDDQGRELKNLNFPNFRTGKDEIIKKTYGFWGTPVEVKMLVTEKWIDWELPFDIPAPEKIPDNKRGTKPVDYR